MAIQAQFGETIFSVGDIVRVHLKLFEAGKERAQVFEGTVISIKGREDGKTFTVRRIGAGGVGVERIFPLSSPWLTKVDVKTKAGRGVRRAKLYFLRRTTKAAQEKIVKRGARKKKQAKKK